MRSSGVLLLSTLVVGSFSRPQQDQHNYEMDLQGGRELMDIENVSWTLKKAHWCWSYLLPTQIEQLFRRSRRWRIYFFHLTSYYYDYFWICDIITWRCKLKCGRDDVQFNIASQEGFSKDLYFFYVNYLVEDRERERESESSSPSSF